MTERELEELCPGRRVVAVAPDNLSHVNGVALGAVGTVVAGRRKRTDDAGEAGQGYVVVKWDGVEETVGAFAPEIEEAP